MESDSPTSAPPNIGKYRIQVIAAALVVTVAIAGALIAWRYAVLASEQEGIAKAALTKSENNEKRALEPEEIAKAENGRFNRLSVVVQLEDAQAEFKGLQPAWPAQITKMNTWLEERGKRLDEALPEVRRTLEELEDKALPQTEEQKQVGRKGHDEYLSFLTQQKKVDSLRRAKDVRLNKSKVANAVLPATTPKDPGAINSTAWPKVSPNPKEREWGDEVNALALARRAAKLAEEQQSYMRYMFGHTLAWALFANGLDDEAKATIQAALAAAPGSAKWEYEGYVQKLSQAIADAPKTFTEAQAELARLDAEIENLDFANEADKILHRTMQGAERKLVAFLGANGARLDVQRRLAWASRIDALTKKHPNARVTWTEAREALRKADGVSASELYDANYHKDHPIELKEQTGLVPIGMNPKTKLWEFYHLRSAYDPRTDADPAALAIPEHQKDGSIEVTEETGIVFVLLPGGTYTMGAQDTDPTGPNYDPLGPNYDPQTQADETPREETVASFFLARHELTQGQWLRLSLQENPSLYPPAGRNVSPKPVTLRHPVEQIDWHMCTALLAQHGLQLPHEREWEYGCRAGTTTPWFCGKSAADLDGNANIQDDFAKRAGTLWMGKYAAFDDGHTIHAPVGSYKPNAFGLYDVHGNVWEWCRNLYRSTFHIRVLRGGGFKDQAQYTRSSFRNGAEPTDRGYYLGLRAARARH